MNRRQISGVLVLRELGIQPSMEQFEDRLIVQKTVYLAQAAGLDLGYHFGWYLRGPYCSSVADDMFAARADPNGVDDAIARWSLDEETKVRFGPLQALIGAVDRDLANRLELLASVHYLIERKQVHDHSPDAITERLQAFGKPFNQEEVGAAIKSLTGVGLLR